jgi:large subunit ribosomal protein L15
MADEQDTVERVTLSNLRPAVGSKRPRKRVGRGPGSGKGKTSGKGHKGHKARSGGSTNPGFEGGQTPLYRRLPKRGFTNPFKVTRFGLNLRDLGKVEGDIISPETLVAARILKKVSDPVKILGHGEIDRKITVIGMPVSVTARTKIEAAGGKVEG